jgi:flagellar biosynthetic protein FliQ
MGASAPTLGLLTEQAQQALLIAAAVSLPVLLLSAIIGLLSSLFQASTQIQDSLITHLPRVLLVGIALVWLGPWMGRTIAQFAARVFGGG